MIGKYDVAALCVMSDGPYPYLVDEWYDITRDARTYHGNLPVVAHPPCGPWGRLRHMCTKQDATLGPFCVAQVRRCGGVLEHPAQSRLFDHCDLPKPGCFPDEYGGETFLVSLASFGSPLYKPTWIYVVGHQSWPEYRYSTACKRTVESLSSRARQYTPYDMADWLCRLAESCSMIEGVPC